VLVDRPISIKIPEFGVYLAESIHSSSFRWQSSLQASCHKIILVHRGEITADLDNYPERIHLSRGSFLPVQSGQIHRIQDSQPATLFLLCLSEAFVAENPLVQNIWDSLVEAGPTQLQQGKKVVGWWDRTLRRILSEQLRSVPGNSLVIQSEACRLMVMLFRLRWEEQDERTENRVGAVLSRVQDTFFEPWSLSKAANEAGLSRRRFSQLAKEKTGQTFVEYITQLRIERAGDLLKQGDHTIVGAAFSSGFNDLSHFYRIFRKYHHQPPGAWIEAQNRMGD